jgi:hypothetical protein
LLSRFFRGKESKKSSMLWGSPPGIAGAAEGIIGLVISSNKFEIKSNQKRCKADPYLYSVMSWKL